MKKVVVILIAVVSIFAFGFLIHYGFKHTRGVPVIIEEKKRPVLEVPLIEKEIDLSKGIEKDFWESLNPVEIKLLYQLMILPWPKAVTPYILAKVFHNQRDIYFYLEWPDESEDRILGVNKFSDACAIMFPLQDNVEAASLMMGFLGNANIWQWKASLDLEYWQKQAPMEYKSYADFHYPFEEEELFVVSKETPQSAVSDLMAVRVSTVTPKERQIVSGRGLFDNGSWRVVFKRSLQGENIEQDAGFGQAKRLCAFAVWNDSQGDRGGRKSISDWVELVLK